VDRLYQLKRNCNACQEKDISLLEGELVALLEDKDPMGSSSRWLVHTGSKFVYLCLNNVTVLFMNNSLFCNNNPDLEWSEKKQHFRGFVCMVTT